MMTGQNTVASEQLRSFVERIERIRAEKKDLAADESAIIAEAKAAGFSPAGIKHCIKVRAAKPHDRAEWEALRDMYLHALGMDVEPPLFRAAGLAAVDTSVREQVIDAMKAFVPPSGKGDILVNMGDKPVRLQRNKDGDVVMSDVVDPPPAQPQSPFARTPGKASKPKLAKEHDDLDDAGAEELGRQFARDNKAVIENPFPFKDARRAAFDKGWREETGTDGMGPVEPNKKDDDDGKK